jgi:hypothetical protein
MARLHVRLAIRAFAAAAVATGILALAGTVPSQAAPKKTPTDADASACIRGGGDTGWEGAIGWCCRENGCWICNVDSVGVWTDCVWDPAYSSRLKGGMTHLYLNGRPTLLTPVQPVTPVQPGVSKQLKLLQGPKTGVIAPMQ